MSSNGVTTAIEDFAKAAEEGTFDSQLYEHGEWAVEELIRMGSVAAINRLGEVGSNERDTPQSRHILFLLVALRALAAFRFDQGERGSHPSAWSRA